MWLGGVRDGVKLATHFAVEGLAGGMEIEVEFPFLGDEVEASDGFDIAGDAGDDGAAGGEGANDAVAVGGGEGDVFVGDSGGEVAIGELGLEVFGEGEVNEDGAEDVGAAAMDVEHDDILGIDVFDLEVDVGGAEVVGDADEAVAEGGTAIAVNGGGGGEENLRGESGGVAFFGWFLLGAEESFVGVADGGTVARIEGDGGRGGVGCGWLGGKGLGGLRIVSGVGGVVGG